MFIISAIADFLGFGNVYPMKLYEKTDEMSELPCLISDYSIKQDWETPTEPLENGEFIGDTQYRQPKSISLNCFVTDENLGEFNQRISTIQTNNNGFVFADRNGEIYPNLWVQSINQTTEANNGYFYTIELKELILIDGFNSAVQYSNAGLSKKRKNGEVANNEKPKSALKKGKDWITKK